MIINSLLSLTEMIFVVLIFLLGLPRVLTSIQLTKAAQGLHSEYYKDKYLVVIIAALLNILIWYICEILLGVFNGGVVLYLIPVVLSFFTIGIWLYFVRTIRVCDIARRIVVKARKELHNLNQSIGSLLNNNVALKYKAAELFKYHLDNLRKLAYSADIIADRNCILDEVNKLVIHYLNEFRKVEIIEERIHDFYYNLASRCERGNEKRELIRKLDELINAILGNKHYNDDLLHTILKNTNKLVCLKKEYEIHETRKNIDQFVKMLIKYAKTIEIEFRKRVDSKNKVHDLNVIVNELEHTYEYLIDNRPGYLSGYNYNLPKANSLFHLIKHSYKKSLHYLIQKYLIMLFRISEERPKNSIYQAFNEIEYLENVIFVSLILLRTSRENHLVTYAETIIRLDYTVARYQELQQGIPTRIPALELELKQLVAQSPYPTEGAPVE